jgi:hypothetical protein
MPSFCFIIKIKYHASIMCVNRVTYIYHKDRKTIGPFKTTLFVFVWSDCHMADVPNDESGIHKAAALPKIPFVLHFEVFA